MELRENAKCVALGENHTLILGEESLKVYALGANNNGNLGQGHLSPSDQPVIVSSLAKLQIKTIYAGRHSAALTSDGRLFVWGPVFND